LQSLFAEMLIEPAQQVQIGDRFRETDRPVIDGSVAGTPTASLPIDQDTGSGNL